MKLILFLLIFISFKGFAQVNGTDISVKQLKDEMKKDSTLIILDVRMPEELNGPLGKIDGVINIPVQQLNDRIKELDKYKHTTIAIICRSGHRSSIAQKTLQEHGFKAQNVLGGMIEFRKQGN